MEEKRDAQGKEYGPNEKRARSMAELSVLSAGGAQNLNVEKLIARIDKPEREKLLSVCDLKAFAKVFEDGEMMRTVNAFFESGLNVCKAARALYMHRNTLTYRLNVLKKSTGLDIRIFDMAVAFKIINGLYRAK